MKNKHSNFSSYKNLPYDLSASIVVFLVALPLCLGIALASGVSLISGIISGIVGGIVVGMLSNSSTSVSGPAAGLVAIVLSALTTLGGIEAFLAAVFVAGIMQIILGMLRAGEISSFFPDSVIRGMLAAIGIILILKQIPHALGYDKDYQGDESFITPTGENTFSTILSSLEHISVEVALVSIISLLFLILCERPSWKKNKILKIMPAPLIVVVMGIVMNYFFIKFVPHLAIVNEEHLVSLPKEGLNLATQFQFPNIEHFLNVKVYIVGLTIALVASLETLLSIDATDKLDTFKRSTSMNRELKAQGVANMVCGLLGGLPVTAVIVRSSANVSSGARTKASAIIHGILLFLCVLFIPHILNQIPIASLSAILLMVGYKLTKPSLYWSAYLQGSSQLIPFVSTIAAILFTDLLIGILIGLGIGLLFVLKQNLRSCISVVTEKNYVLLRLRKDVTFINKIYLKKILQNIPDNSYLIIDCKAASFIDHDILNALNEFISTGEHKNIQVEINGDLCRGIRKLQGSLGH